MPSHPAHSASQEGVGDQTRPATVRWRFTLRDWLLRLHRDRERPVNLRAGVEPPHGYPFDPRF